MMGRKLLTAIMAFGLSLSGAHAQAEPRESKRTLSAGLELHETTVSEGVSASYLRVDLHEFNVRVLSALVPIGSLGIAPSTSPERAVRGLYLKDYLTLYHAAVVLSGGYMATFSPPTPLGLVRSNGIVISPPDHTWLTDGYFCSEPGHVQIERWIDLAEFRDCLQAGPLLLLKGKPQNDVPKDRRAQYQQFAALAQQHAFICTSISSEFVMGVTGKVDTDPRFIFD